MKKTQSISRRQALGTAVASAAGIVLAKGGSAEASYAPAKAKVPMPKNEDFYDADGKFLEDKARQAYYDMFERFGYPNPEPQQKLMWVHDFGMGDFVHAGMAGVFWWNSKEYSYFGHSIYLLPGQQIPEHKHMKTKDGPAKMEAWHCRYGMIHCLGTGPETKPMPIKLPKSQEPFRTVKKCHPRDARRGARVERTRGVPLHDRRTGRCDRQRVRHLSRRRRPGLCQPEREALIE